MKIWRNIIMAYLPENVPCTMIYLCKYLELLFLGTVLNFETDSSNFLFILWFSDQTACSICSPLWPLRRWTRTKAWGTSRRDLFRLKQTSKRSLIIQTSKRGLSRLKLTLKRSLIIQMSKSGLFRLKWTSSRKWNRL